MYSLKRDSQEFDTFWSSVIQKDSKHIQPNQNHNCNNHMYHSRKNIPYYSEMTFNDRVKSEFSLINRQNLDENKQFKISDQTSSKDSLNFNRQYNNLNYISLTTHLNSYNKDLYSAINLNRKVGNENLKESIERNNINLYKVEDYKEYKSNKKNKNHDFGNEKKETLILNRNDNVHQEISKSLFGKTNISSDIFFNKPLSNIDHNSNNECKKSGEKYLFYKYNKPYTSNSQSKSDWMPLYSKNSLLNHTRNEYNILNPLTKNNQNMNNFNYLNKEIENKITYRSKGICEFVDITRNGAPKPNKEFIKVVKNSISPFNRRKDVCSDYASLSHSYKGLGLPFKKED